MNIYNTQISFVDPKSSILLTCKEKWNSMQLLEIYSQFLSVILNFMVGQFDYCVEMVLKLCWSSVIPPSSEGYCVAETFAHSTKQ